VISGNGPKKGDKLSVEWENTKAGWKPSWHDARVVEVGPSLLPSSLGTTAVLLRRGRCSDSSRKLRSLAQPQRAAYKRRTSRSFHPTFRHGR
jgi:hypothetical protein